MAQDITELAGLFWNALRNKALLEHKVRSSCVGMADRRESEVREGCVFVRILARFRHTYFSRVREGKRERYPLVILRSCVKGAKD